MTGAAAGRTVAVGLARRAACVRRLRRVARGVGRALRALRAVAEAGAGRLRVAARQLELAGDLRLGRLARLGRGVGLGDAAEAAVGERVAVGVLELDEAAEALGLAHAHDAAVVDGDDGGAAAGEDLDPAAMLVGLDDEGGVVAPRGLALGVALLDLPGVGGLRLDREAALGQPGQRADIGRAGRRSAGRA